VPFILKEFPAVSGKKIQQFLIDDVGLTISTSQKLLAKCRVFDHNDKVLQNGEKLHCDFVKIALFEGKTRGLKPLFNAKEFAIFDKPSGVIVHPTSRNTQYSLLDEIRFHFGDAANLAHRIDQETSGLVLVTKNKYSDMILKEMFENKLYEKKYLAIVEGKIDKNITIDSGIKKATNSIIGVKMVTANDGKVSITHIKPLEYNSIKKQTLVEATPITGRQHQIRVHLNSIGHKIVGDPIYGVDEAIADKYLLKKLSLEERVKYMKDERLRLQANFLKFQFEQNSYEIYSKLKFNAVK